MRDRLNIAFPSALLVVVAVLQLIRAHTIKQSPWKGGGFGMFASADRPDNRVLRCWILTPEGEERVELPPYMDGIAMDAMTVPTRANLLRVAESMETGKWIEATGTLPPDLGSREGIDDPAVRTPGPQREETKSLTPGGIYLVHLRKEDPEPPDAVVRTVIGARVRAVLLEFESHGPAFSIRLLGEARSGQE